jgi:4-hydroxysphinganine ceramide fatty acyl 2-hydroxylase
MVSSAVNYWIVMIVDLAAALGFLALGWSQFSGRWGMAGAAVITGFMFWGFLEYASHRWLGHGPPSVVRRGHAQHHVSPKALIATPLFVFLIVAVLIWRLARLALPADVASLLVFGFYAGYNYFALVHHWQHHHVRGLLSVAYLERLDRVHHLHHHRPVVNFGISTTLWDRLFGTFQPANERATTWRARAR